MVIKSNDKTFQEIIQQYLFEEYNLFIFDWTSY